MQIDNEIKWQRDEFTCKICGKKDFLKWGLVGDKPLDKVIVDCKNELLARSVCDTCLADNKKKEELKELNKKISEKIKSLPYNDFDPEKTKDKGQLSEIMLRLWQAKRHAYVQGVYDSGKTRSCANIFVFLAKQMINGVYLKAGEFIDECTSLAVNKDKDAVNLKLKQLIANNKLIMLDDIGKHKITDAGGEVLYKFLDIIIESNSDCKVWITANKHIDQICSRFYDEDVGNAFVSRIKRMEFVNVTQNGLKWGVGQI